MRIVNTMRISKGKAVLHYVDLIVKVFQKNSEITQGVVCVCGWGGEGGSLESEQRQTERDGPSMCVDSRFKKNAGIFKIKFYSCSRVSL